MKWITFKLCTQTIGEMKEKYYFITGGVIMRDQELLKRAHITIMENVYEPEGYLWSPYRCITPAKNFFKGIWNWDSAFHAIGISRYDTNLEKESISGFFKFQRDDGYLPDAVLEDGCIIAGSSKPPVFAWATEIVYKRDKSTVSPTRSMWHGMTTAWMSIPVLHSDRRRRLHRICPVQRQVRQPDGGLHL